MWILCKLYCALMHTLNSGNHCHLPRPGLRTLLKWSWIDLKKGSILRKLGEKKAVIFCIRGWGRGGESQCDVVMDKANTVLGPREIFPVGKYIDASTQSPVRPLLWSVLQFGQRSMG